MQLSYCVRKAKVLGEFDYVRLPKPNEVNRTTGVPLRLGSITERSIDHAGKKLSKAFSTKST